MALVASEPPALLSYPVPHKISFAKGPGCLLRPKERERHIHAVSGPHSRLLVRSICQLPEEKPRVRGKAMMRASLCSGSQEEHRTIYYMPSAKAKQKGGPHQAFFRGSCPQILYSPDCSRLLGQCLPTLDNLRNFFLRPPTQVLSLMHRCQSTASSRDCFSAFSIACLETSVTTRF